MLTKLKQWLSPSASTTHDHPGGHVDSDPDVNGQASSRARESAREGDIDSFIEAVQRADAKGHSPWVLRDKAYLDTLRRALEFTLHRQVWLQREQEHVEHWQGRLLALRHGDGPPLGMVLACRPDDEAAWQLMQSWLPDFDSWAIADHACMAMQKRLVADPARLDSVEAWTDSADLWTRRAALVATLPWTKQNNPKPEEIAARDRILGWAAGYLPVKNGILQKAIAWWIRDLSRHDPARATAFLQENAAQMKAYAVKEASRYLPERENPAS